MARFTERFHKGYVQTMALKGRPPADEKSRYQYIKVFNTFADGRVPILDDVARRPRASRRPVPKC